MKAHPKSTRPTARDPEQDPAALHGRWQQLHRCDREPWPDERLLAALARRQTRFAAWLADSPGPRAVAHSLQEAWQAFHEGDFARAMKLGGTLGPLGAIVAGKAAAVQSLTSKHGSSSTVKLLSSEADRCGQSVEILPDQANGHYVLALLLGRYSQHISILQALADGLASRVASHLTQSLKLEPKHAEAHLAFGLYNAEIVHQVGSLIAGLTYGVSAQAALQHLNRALELVPDSPVVQVEHANGLLLVDPKRYAQQAATLFAQAAAAAPQDAMERIYVERAGRRGAG